MSKLYIFEMKPGQKIGHAAKKAIALARKMKTPILFKFDKFTQMLLTPMMEKQDILSMYHSMSHTKLSLNNPKSR